MARADDDLEHFLRKPRAMRFFHAHKRLLFPIAAGLVTLMLWPADWRLATRLLVSWDVAITLYMAFAYTTFATTDHAHIRRNALMQDDGRFAILALVAISSFASLGAIIALLGATGRTDGDLVLAALTVVLSWAMIHTTFALHYANDYYRGAKAGGFDFPGGEAPDYWDFVYFSFVLGMTAQTSDVSITDRMIRRTVTAHGLVSFLFNTALLALMINIAASAL